MNEEEMQVQHMHHAFLVAWGWFGDHPGPHRLGEGQPAAVPERGLGEL